MERSTFNRVGPIISYVLVIAVNYLSNVLPLGGQTQKQISDQYPSLFTPAPFTFSIWGVIYLGLLAYIIYQWLSPQRNSYLLERVSKLFMLSCAANIGWLFAWHYGFLLLSMLFMLTILLILVLIYWHIANSQEETSWVRRLCLHLPFSLYLGWITVATIANASILQLDMGWENALLSNVSWTLLKLAFAGAIAATMLLRRGDIAFAMVIAWAAYGIMSKQGAVPEIFGAAGAVAAAMILLSAYEGFKRL